MKLLFLFIDGLGLGENDPAINPLVRFAPNFFSTWLKQPLTQVLQPIFSDTVCLLPLDATLGVAGLPQSATGQTTLFTGVNAAKIVGHHVQAFPGPQLKKLISTEGLLAKLVQAGYKVKGANAYLPNYEKLIASRKRRHAATTLALLEAGLPLASVEELRQRKALYQDITNETVAAFGYEVPVIKPCQAGRNLAQIVQQHDFTLYEYFQTDRYGHKQDWQMAEKIVRYIDELLWGFWRQAAGECTLLLVSDHGNFEDLSVKTHTMNKVPLLLIGPASRKLAEQITDFSSVAQAIFSVMQGERENG